MPKNFDNCVKKIMNQGKDKSEAFAISKSQFEKAGLPIRENIEDVKIFESYEDDNGDIVIAENVKLYLDTNISVIEE